MNLFYEIVVGGTGQYDQPVGSTEFPIDILPGVSGYLEKRGVGRLSSSEYTVLPGGGFSVPNATVAGEVFYFIPDFYTGSITTGWYTNGFNFPKVMAVLGSRVGWKDENSLVESYNQVSRSGRFFNDGSFHPLVTIPNVKSTIGSESLAKSPFNTALQMFTRGAIMSCLSAVFNTSELIDNTLLFDRKNDDKEIAGGNKFVGVRFKVAPKYALQINSIQLFFNEAATFNLYLFHETQTAPLWQQSVTSAAGETIQVDLSTELILNYLATNYSGGAFYLGYFQEDLGTAKAINEYGCRNTTKVVGYDFIQSDKVGSSFDRSKVTCSSETYGLNMEVSTFRDHTESIIKQSNLFDNAIGLQVAHNVAKMIIYSTRSNKEERILKEGMGEMGLRYELDGSLPIPDSPKTTGLQQKINSELKRVRESFFPAPKSKIVSLC